MTSTDVLLVVNLAATAIIVVLLLTRRSAGDVGRVDDSVRSALLAHREEVRSTIAAGSRETQDRLSEFTKTVDENLRTSRQEMNETLARFSKSIEDSGAVARRDAADGRQALETAVGQRLEAVTEKLRELREANEAKLAAIETKLEAEVNKMRESNETKLEQMRVTVDEKLHGTLEKRLGESFGQVVDKLAEVQKGLGEMQTLATGVGDLKRVLTNVKNRGSWGEVQLGKQLEDMLSHDQYESNVMVKPGSRDIVEFAIRLPGRSEGEPVYLPIDAKFPQEDYERLLAAQEGGLAEAVDAAGRAVERAVKAQAATIAEKYIAPPHTTDFAIMYLPTEGLYAEVIRRPGLSSELQHKHHVLITGPTTLMAILNSLQMGFRTLRIEKSAGDVVRLLGAVKTEFEKYAAVWEKVDKQLGTVQNTVQSVGTRTRAIKRSLRTIEMVDPGLSSELLALEDFEAADEADAEASEPEE